MYIDAKDSVASVECNRILKIPRIQEYVKTKHKEAKLKLDTSHTRLLDELNRWANSDITETIGLTPNQVKELPIELRRLITKYKHSKRIGEGWTEEVIELTFVSKEKAMEMIHKHTGFYSATKLEIDMPKMPDVVIGARVVD